eukprot:1144257-Pelagomonas_calceolata.AAC.2
MRRLLSPGLCSSRLMTGTAAKVFGLATHGNGGFHVSPITVLSLFKVDQLRERAAYSLTGAIAGQHNSLGFQLWSEHEHQQHGEQQSARVYCVPCCNKQALLASVLCSTDPQCFWRGLPQGHHGVAINSLLPCAMDGHPCHKRQPIPETMHDAAYKHGSLREHLQSKLNCCACDTPTAQHGRNLHAYRFLWHNYDAASKEQALLNNSLHPNSPARAAGISAAADAMANKTKDTFSKIGGVA